MNITKKKCYNTVADLGGGARGYAPPPPPCPVINNHKKMATKRGSLCFMFLCYPSKMSGSATEV